MMSILSAITLTWPGMVMGVGLIALPIAAHLMRRQARRSVVFPSVQLLTAATAGQSSMFRLRRWWLLLLRCLAVAAIVLAFAQPIWFSTQAEAVGGRGASVVILVDLSASSAQQYAGVSAVHSMKADAGGVLDTLVPGEDFVNIVYATARPSAALPGMTANPQALRSEVMAFEPTYERADLAGALAMAGQLLADRTGARRLVILSDLQTSNWADALETWPEQTPLPAGTRVTILAPGPRPTKNLALHGAWVSSRTPRVGRPTKLGVMLTNHSDQPQSTTVRLRINDQNKKSQSLTVEPRQTREVVFTAALDRSDSYRVEFALPGDGMPADDRCYLVARAIKRVPVVVITDDDTDAPGTAGYFMVRALAPYGDARDRYRVRRMTGGEVSRSKLGDAAAVFIGQTGDLSPDGLLDLYRYMEAGGGVVYFLGDGPVGKNLAALDRIAPDGVLPWLPVSPRDFTTGGEPWTIADGDWGTPLLKRFDQAGRDALTQIQVRQAWAGDEIHQRAHTLLRFTDDTPALAWRAVGAGRLMLMNVNPKATHSDLGKYGVFVALMQALADELSDAKIPSPENVAGQAVSFTPADPIDLDGPTPVVLQPDGKASVDADFLLPDNRAFDPLRGPRAPALDSFETRTGVVIHSPAVPGFYTVKQGDTVLGVTAVNIDPRESDLRRVDADELQSVLSAGLRLKRDLSRRYAGPDRSEGSDTRAFDPLGGPQTSALNLFETKPGDVQAEVQSSNIGSGLNAHGRAIWGWLLLVAMGLFGVEMGLQGYWKR